MRRKDGTNRHIVCHHLYGQQNFFHLSLEPQNGIPLLREIHNEYHQIFGFKNATLGDFISYLNMFLALSTPISRQTNLEKFEGSETRVYDPKKINKLQEHLTELLSLLKTNSS